MENLRHQIFVLRLSDLYEEKCCVFEAAKGRVTSESFICNLFKEDRIFYCTGLQKSFENSHQ